ncbi:DUF423 domain-containing protein [Opitutales bacterium]|nr:DUF423 domain-containing protein [Opitutales bacterium]MDB3958433.1 DUF423 domain-containing protein [Opitutales bacterium]
MQINWPLFAGAIFGSSSVLLAAYGAHGLEQVFLTTPKMRIAYGNAVDFQMLHSLLLVILGLTLYIPKFRLPAYLWKTLLLSIILFCMSIYLWVFGGPNWLVRVTPFGGMGFVLSWLMLIRIIWLNSSSD